MQACVHSVIKHLLSSGINFRHHAAYDIRYDGVTHKLLPVWQGASQSISEISEIAEVVRGGTLFRL